MAAKSPERPGNNTDQPSTGNTSSFLGAVMRSPLSWMRAARRPSSNLDVVKDDAMAVDDSAGMHESSRALERDNSFDTVPTQSLASQSSQEYERSWGSLLSRPEELERGAASAELVDNPPPPVSRESSGSSLGKRCRSDSVVGPPNKKRTSNHVEDDPFIVPKFRAATINPSSAVLIRKIAQPPEILQELIQSLSWGVQWIIGELITAGLITYDDIKPNDLRKLRGSNEQAASKVVQLLCPPTKNVSAGPTTAPNYAQLEDHDTKTLWAELDHEEAFLKANPHAGLGCGAGYGVESSWYGGQVHFTAKLKEKNKSKNHGRGTDGLFDIVLQKPELGTSNRFARRFGSRRFIRVRVPKTILGGNKFIPSSAVVDYFRAPFLFHGRIFRAFNARDGNVFLVETSDPEICKPAPGPPVMSFLEFLDFHNPRALNSKQALAKWSARFALGLSNSVPGLRIDPKNIHRIADIVAPYNGSGKPPTEKVMTDGCGFINIYALRKLQANLQWEKLPIAVQVRIGGAKGLLLLHPDGKYAEGELAPHVWIRPSQTKIHYDDNKQPDPAHFTIDVLQPARLKYPSRLSTETIINIAHNQTGSATAKHQILKQLMHKGLEEAIGGLVRCLDVTSQEAAHARPILWHEISKAGGIMAMRMARDFSGSARARGYASRWDEVERDEEEDTSSAQPLTEIPHTGPPATAEETAMNLISAGFSPLQSTFLNDKIKYIVKKVITKYTQKFRIDVPGSAEAFCVPDPKGVLEPGEIFLRTSQPIKNQHGVDVDVLQGDVLLARHPTKTPTDVQRVKAVFKQELFEYTDVIIFSTKGERSPASMLAGGDYDGDTVIIIWECGLVDNFVNADVKFSMPPEGLDSNYFELGANETVAQFEERTTDMSSEDLIRNLQAVLLGALKDVSIVGSYSIFHENAVYSKGYDHEETIRLAYMFCACLDGGKSGLRVKDVAYKADKNRWDKRGPQWKETGEPLDYQKPLNRDKNLGPFIMDELKSHGEALSKKVIKKWQEKLPPIDTPDDDLTRPWTEATARAIELERISGSSQFSADLKKISDHVDGVRDQYLAAWSANGGSSSEAFCKSPSVGSRQRSPNTGIKINSDIIIKFPGPKGLLAFNDSQREELKASYAYWLDTRRTPFKIFAYQIASQELLRIKANSLGGTAVTPEFYRCFDIQSGLKALGRRTGQ